MAIFRDLPEWGIFFITMFLFTAGFFIPGGHANVLIYSFTFLIMMEVVRTIYEYIFHPHSRMKIRYIVDASIFFGFRELFVGWLMLKTELELGIIIMLISLITLCIVIFLRTKVIKDSPENLDTYYKKEIK